ncbi:MAG: type II toxin-antitoxin system prevent-host-death family antitoxin [Proteobacteria bacterium]|nr:type II toxin-antitoxin system prevent-host-death family antitoxin [Pseudomonadota bacterium]
MKSIAITHMKASLSQFLKLVKTGEEVLITDRGKPVAKIVPVDSSDVALPPHLRELERNGLAHIGSGKIKKSFWDLPRPIDVESAALQSLRDERDASR